MNHLLVGMIVFAINIVQASQAEEASTPSPTPSETPTYSPSLDFTTKLAYPSLPTFSSQLINWVNGSPMIADIASRNGIPKFMRLYDPKTNHLRGVYFNAGGMWISARNSMRGVQQQIGLDPQASFVLSGQAALRNWETQVIQSPSSSANPTRLLTRNLSLLLQPVQTPPPAPAPQPSEGEKDQTVVEALTRRADQIKQEAIRTIQERNKRNNTGFYEDDTHFIEVVEGRRKCFQAWSQDECQSMVTAGQGYRSIQQALTSIQNKTDDTQVAVNPVRDFIYDKLKGSYSTIEEKSTELDGSSIKTVTYHLKTTDGKSKTAQIRKYDQSGKLIQISFLQHTGKMETLTNSNGIDLKSLSLAQQDDFKFADAKMKNDGNSKLSSLITAPDSYTIQKGYIGQKGTTCTYATDTTEFSENVIDLRTVSVASSCSPSPQPLCIGKVSCQAQLQGGEGGTIQAFFEMPVACSSREDGKCPDAKTCVAQSKSLSAEIAATSTGHANVGSAK